MELMSDGTPRQEVERFLRGIPFPALKHDVIHAARRSGAPNDLVSVLENLPVTRFDSLEHLLQTYGQMI